MANSTETLHTLSVGSHKAILTEIGVETLAIIQDADPGYSINHYLETISEVLNKLLSEVKDDKDYMDMQETFKTLAFLSRDLRNLQNPKNKAQ